MVYFNDNKDEANVTLEQLYDLLAECIENEVKDDDEYCVS